jgi:hypothetical protein
MEITLNRRAGTELSPYIRSNIIGMKLSGQNGVTIAQDLHLPKSTVYKTINLSLQRVANQSKPRSGRPPKYDIRDERRVLRLVRQYPKMMWRHIVLALDLGLSKRTHQRILKKHNITKWLVKKRPFLTPAHTAHRLA